MITHSIRFTPEAELQLAKLFRFIANDRSPAIAARYVSGIVAQCESLQHFPYRGVSRDDIRKGLRTAHYRKRAVIAFAVEGAVVSIIGVFYGGQDYTEVLKD